MRTKYSEKHYSALDFIKVFKQRNGYPPTIREIGEYMSEYGLISNTSTSYVVYLLHKLEIEGLIERVKGISRGIRITNKGELFNG